MDVDIESGSSGRQIMYLRWIKRGSYQGPRLLRSRCFQLELSIDLLYLVATSIGLGKGLQGGKFPDGITAGLDFPSL